MMERKEIDQWCMFMHLGLLAGYVVPLAGLIVPIVMWQTKKAEAPEIDEHGRMIANAILSWVLYGVVSAVLIFVVVGIFMLWVLGLMAIAFPIIGAIKANDGQLWRYPFTLKLI
jgi:uncharacterized Tic20 family protein